MGRTNEARQVTPEVIEGAIRGDREAVAALTRAYLPRVFGLCLRLSRHRDLAEEASQEAFVRALRALPRLREPGRLTSWMLTIAANTTRELMRQEARTTALDYEPPAVEPQVDDAREARQKALDQAVATLPDDERQLFLLHTVEGVRLKDLAREHSTSLPAMKSRVHRIRSKIRVSALAVLQQAGAYA
jgi:RNA polymerase sigma-70 factor, ECF subfamily